MNKIFLFIIIFIASASCKKTDKLDSLHDLLEFKIEASLNPNVLENDIIAAIAESQVSITMPAVLRNTELIATVKHNGKEVQINGKEQDENVIALDWGQDINLAVVAEDGTRKDYKIVVKFEGIPQIYIETQGGATITSKEDYLNANLRIEGNGAYEDLVTTARIRGRGNTTWPLPKKPYRIKLDKKASILGLNEAKDWVLLANYLDETLMLNAVAMKAGQLLEMPYTNTMISVELILNNIYMGNYMLTEQVEVSKGRINIEDGGILFELDTYFDEDWQFISNGYELPVMIKYPELEDLPIQDANESLRKIEEDFNKMESSIASADFPNNNFKDFIDINDLVNYFIVYTLTSNEEINHPKSTFMYKPENGKYKMGPIWDFDWAFSFDGNNKHFNSSRDPLFVENSSLVGTKFFSRFLLDPEIKSLYKQKWISFKSQKLGLLLEYIDEYAKLITESQKRDYLLWDNGSSNFEQDVSELRNWIISRAEYMDAYASSL
jgi:hypothetical protein